MKIKCLLVCLVFAISCAGLTSDYRARDMVMFPDSTKEEVWKACMDVLLDKGCLMPAVDSDIGFIQAYRIYYDSLSGLDMRYTWTVQIMEGVGGVNLSIHFDRELGWIGGGASGHVAQFIKDVRKRLEIVK